MTEDDSKPNKESDAADVTGAAPRAVEPETYEPPPASAPTGRGQEEPLSPSPAEVAEPVALPPRIVEAPVPPVPGRKFDGLRVASMIGGALIVLLAWGALHLWGLGNSPFHTKGEPREALVVWEMVHGGGWILPRRNGVQVPSKPPMFHWLGALTSLASGRTDEWSVRLPSAALSGATVLVVFLAGASFWGVRAALISALVLLTCFEWARSATSARVDMTLTFGLTLSFVALLLLRRNDRALWRVMFYAGMAWAILSKGLPAGMVPPILMVIFLCVVDRGLVIVRRLKLARGLLAVILITGTWYALAIREGGPAFIGKQIWAENVLRVAGGSAYAGGHLHSARRLLSELLGGLLPWTLFLPVVLQWLWQTRRGGQQPGTRIFLVAWLLAVLLPYTLASSKRGVYLLPLYPAVALLIGAWWDAALREGAPFDWLRRILAPLGWLLVVLFSLGGIAVAAEIAGLPLLTGVAGFMRGETAGHMMAIADTIPKGGALLCFLLLVAAASTAVLAAGATTGRWAFVFAGLFVAMGASVIAVQNVALPAIAREKTRKDYAQEVRQIVPDPTRVFAYGGIDYGFTFYWGGRIPVYDGSLTADGPEYLLVKERAWVNLAPVERERYEIVPAAATGRSGNVGRLLLIRRILAETGAVPSAEAPAQ